MATYDAVIPSQVEVIDGIFDSTDNALLGLVAPCAELLVWFVGLHQLEQAVYIEMLGNDTGTYFHGIIAVALLLDVYGYEYGRLTHVQGFAHALKPRCGGISATTGHRLKELGVVDTVHGQSGLQLAGVGSIGYEARIRPFADGFAPL